MGASNPDPPVGRERRQSPSVAARQAERREACVAAAFALVRRGGAAAITAQSLADEMAVTPAALYRIFPSLDALRAELVVRSLAFLGDAMDAALARRARADAPARVAALAHALPAVRTEAPERYALIDHALSAPDVVFGDDDAHLVEEHVGAVLARVERALAEGVAQGAFTPGDARRRALALLACVHGAGHLAKRNRLERERGHHDRAVLDEAIDALLRGWAR